MRCRDRDIRHSVSARASARVSAHAAVLATLVLLAVGCGLSVEKRSIPAAPAERDSDAPNLGPGVQPLSFGPGDKSSPSWHPSGEELAFVVDGYAVDKPLYGRASTRQTPEEFGATRVEWNVSGESLTILAPPQPVTTPGPPEAPETAAQKALTVYSATPGDALEVQEVSGEARAISPTPGHESVVAATEVAPYQTELGLVTGDSYQPYGILVEGRVTGLSISPDGRQAVVATQEKAAPGRFRIQVYDLFQDEVRTVARLGDKFEVLGEPQLTSQGIYYVAGEKGESGSEDKAGLYTLYRIPPDGSAAPEPVTGVGEDFVASSLRVSPEGDQLAIVGRRNPSSSTNLYVLDLQAEELNAVTVNESMEIKAEPENLAWSPDGESVAIIARGILSGPEVYDAPVENLLEEFYNLYEVPAETPAPAGE